MLGEKSVFIVLFNAPAFFKTPFFTLKTTLDHHHLSCYIFYMQIGHKEPKDSSQGLLMLNSNTYFYYYYHYF